MIAERQDVYMKQRTGLAITMACLALAIASCDESATQSDPDPTDA